MFPFAEAAKTQLNFTARKHMDPDPAIKSLTIISSSLIMQHYNFDSQWAAISSETWVGNGCNRPPTFQSVGNGLVRPAAYRSAEDISNRINSNAATLLRYRTLGLWSNSCENTIVNSFVEAAEQGGSFLEAVKHNVAREQSDFIDLRDVLDALSKRNSECLYTLFRTVSVLDQRYHTIVLSDLDSTAVEKSSIAPSIYADGSVIFGFTPLVNALTHNGSTTMVFISARPKFIENWSIRGTAQKLHGSGIKAFSFETGELPGSALFVAAQAAQAVGARKRARRLLIASAVDFAERKYASYRKLAKAFPRARFVFFGDDSQGDYMFANALVQHNPSNYAFIRSIASPGMKVAPKSHNLRSDDAGTAWRLPLVLGGEEIYGAYLQAPAQIVYHRSYYEALYMAPPGLFSADQIMAARVGMMNEYNARYIHSVDSFCAPEEAQERDAPWIARLFSE